MKTSKIFLISIALLFSFKAFNQKSDVARPIWSAKLKSLHAIVENKGQDKDINDRKILYSYYGSNEKFFFTDKGLIIRLDTCIFKKNLASAYFNLIGDKEEANENLKMKWNSYYVYAEWQNASSDVKIEPSQQTEGYYTFRNTQQECQGYTKITYKNIYPNIDIEYMLPNDSAGIKYNIILHPGADISNVQLLYKGDVKQITSDNAGNIILKTPTHNLVDHAPKSFVMQSGKNIQSSFILKGNVVDFYLSDNQITEDIAIDPWVSGINISGNDYGFDVEYDFSQNLYVYTRAYSASALYVSKFSTTGALVWTHTVTTQTMYEGNFMLDKLANKIYISEGFNGSGATAYRIDVNGVVDGFVSSQDANLREMWDMLFDCNMNRIIGFGGGTNSNLNGGLINPNTGAITTANFTGLSPTDQDIVSETVDHNGNVYVCYAHVSGYCDHYLDQLNSTLNGHNWQVLHGMYGFEECSNHPPDYTCTGPGSNAFNALDVNDSYLYYYDGQGLAAFNKANGTRIAAISVGYSGVWYTPKAQGGIAVDDCNNIYIGGPSGNLLSYSFNGTSFTAPVNVPIGWPGTFVWDVKYDRNSNYLFVSGYNGVSVLYAAQSAACDNNSLTDSTYCIGAQMGGGIVTVHTNLPNPTMNYIWYDSGGNIINQTNATTSLTNSLSNLANGTYVVRAFINPPCGAMAIDTVVINCPTCGGTIAPTMITCFGGNDGAAVFTPSNGQPPYTYVWTTGSHNTTISNLIAGDYTITLTDANTCTSVVTTTITQPSIVQSTMTNTDVTCFGGNNGTATVSTHGGTPPYTVLWNNAQTDSTATGLTAASYTVIVTDSHGCTATQSVNIHEPPQLVITASASPATVCIGASSTLTANGAVSYIWDHLIGLGNPQTVNPTSTTTYQVTGTDASGCTAITTTTVTVFPSPNIFITGNNTICQGQCTTLTGNGGVSYVWETGQNTISISVCPISTTSYHVTGTDANGCIDSASYQVNVMPKPIANAGNDTAICGLSYTLHAIPSVGTGTWTSPQNVTINPSNSPNANITVTQTGFYTLIWTENNNGCIDADTVIIQLTQIPTSAFTADTIACSGNASLVTFHGISDVNSSFTWNWDGGNATPGSGIGPHQVNWSTTIVHTVTLSVSTNGCTSPTTSVQILNPTPVVTSLSKTDLLCHGDATGTVTLTVSGGRPPYTFHWSNTYTTQNLINVAGGIYTVTVTDASGCTNTNGITVNEPSQLVISLTPSQYICIGQPAYLSITATGGTIGYQYFWDNQLSNSTIVVYPDTTTQYHAYVVDGNGCSSSVLTTTVYVAPPIHVNLLANTNHVCPGDPVMLTPIIWGGVGPPYIIYNQNGNVVTPPIYIYPTQTGYYTVRVEDACGTWDTSGVYIYVWPLPPADVLADTLQGCVPLTVTFNEENPDNGQTYLWDFGDQSNLSLSKNPVHTYTTSGTFTVTITVTSIHGCKTTKVYNDMITVWPKPHAAFVWNPEVVTEIEPVVNFTNHSIGAAWYEWMFGDNDSSSVINPEHRYPGAGDYNVLLVAISNKGCVDTAKALIKVLEQYTFYAPTAFSPDGDRTNDFFYALAHGIKEEGFKLEVYDRWGEVIWSTTIYSKATECSEKWDGRAKNHLIVPIGTYTWRAVFKDDMNRAHDAVGAVTVIR